MKDGVSENKRERYIEIIADEAVKMETMVEEMLDLVRLESQAIKLNTDAVALGDMIEDIAGRLGPQLKDKELEVVLVSTTEQSVEGDRSKLEQVIYNMMMNAIRHAVPKTDILIEISRPEGQVRISIENQGEQISEAERQYIWERFYRVERSRNRKMGEPVSAWPSRSRFSICMDAVMVWRTRRTESVFILFFLMLSTKGSQVYEIFTVHSNVGQLNFRHAGCDYGYPWRICTGRDDDLGSHVL